MDGESKPAKTAMVFALDIDHSLQVEPRSAPSKYRVEQYHLYGLPNDQANTADPVFRPWAHVQGQREISKSV